MLDFSHQVQRLHHKFQLQLDNFAEPVDSLVVLVKSMIKANEWRAERHSWLTADFGEKC